MFKSLFRRAAPAPPPRVPDGVRVYAIGDIHGCDALFAQLLDMIDADDAARGPADTQLILIGDLVDRGPDSRAVVERALRLTQASDHVRVLGGNHEELFLLALAGEAEALKLFARVGGRATAISYGIDPAAYDAADFDELLALLDAHVPPEHRGFLANTGELIEIGDYAFVHAGIRPGVPLAEQKGEDLRWIRGSFLNHRDPFERMIVHGHTITDAVDEQPNRIGIDTGAYASGRLTAIGLEGDQRWFLATG